MRVGIVDIKFGWEKLTLSQCLREPILEIANEWMLNFQRSDISKSFITCSIAKPDPLRIRDCPLKNPF